MSEQLRKSGQQRGQDGGSKFSLVSTDVGALPFPALLAVDPLSQCALACGGVATAAPTGCVQQEEEKEEKEEEEGVVCAPVARRMIGGCAVKPASA